MFWGVVMTKPVVCRIIESRPLEAAAEPPCQYPDISDLTTGRITEISWVRRQRHTFCSKRYPVNKQDIGRAAAGTWIDIYA